MTVTLSSELSAQRSTERTGPTMGAKDRKIREKINKFTIVSEYITILMETLMHKKFSSRERYCYHNL